MTAPRPGSEVQMRTSDARSPFPAEPLAGTGKTFNLGIDVGTSTTKLCVRPPGDRSPIHVVTLEPQDDQGSALCPSLVTVCGEKVYFGGTAQAKTRRRPGKVFEALKMCVACELGWPPRVPSTSCECIKSQRGDGCSAEFPLRTADERVKASDLLMLFLAWVMGEARRSLMLQFDAAEPPRITYSVGAPMDQIDLGAGLSDVYDKLVFRAWRLSGAMTQGLAVSKALAWIAEVKAVEVPPAGDRSVELCAESSANVAGYTLSPDVETGQYAVVDIGAWTTEVAFFRLIEVASKWTGKRTLAFHASRSYPVAAGEVDERCSENVRLVHRDATMESGRTLNAAVREHRERGVFGDKPLPLRAYGESVVPRKSALAFARDVVRGHLHTSWRETLRAAYEKEKRESLWHGEVRVLLAGGGSLDCVLRSAAAHETFVAEESVVPRPKDLEDLPQCDDYRRYLVAYGLAHSSARWPHAIPPSGTQPLEPPPEALRPTPEELGYVEP